MIDYDKIAREDKIYLDKDGMKSAFKLLMQNELSLFIEQVFHTVDPNTDYHNNWHIDAIAEALDACTRGEINRLIINMPPRLLKSISATVAWPAWLLGKDPTKRILSASYASKLALKHNIDCRLVVGSPWYQYCFPETIIKAGDDQKAKFTTTQLGFKMATSVGGSATGEGGDILIVDDPTNPEEAYSELERDTANRWFDQTFSNRLNDKRKGKGVIVVIMQRLHEDDLSGHLLAKDIGWEHLKLPAELKSEKTISIGNFKRDVKKGDLLFPQLLTAEVLAHEKGELGSFAYSGQYMQDPVPAGGGILKANWWRLWPHKKPPECELILQCYDTAFNIDEESDYSARTTWGVFNYAGSDGISRYGVVLIEAVQDRWEYPELREEIKRSAVEHKPDVILIEDKGSGISLCQELKRTTNLPIKPIKVSGGRHSLDKVARAHLSAAYLEGGAVWYMDREWAKDVIKQCAQFPKASHDDIVDTCTMCWNYLRKRFTLELEMDFDDKEWGGKDPSKTKRFYG